VDKNQLLEDSLKVYADFSGFDLEHLKQVGVHIGNSPAALKQLYMSYLKKDDKSEIAITGRGIEVKLDSSSFLKFMNLVDVCYSEILPIGSVVEADLEQFPKGFRKMYETNNEVALFVITGRKSPAHDAKSPVYVDYSARLFPFGETEFIPAFHLSNMMIKKVVHKGFTNADEVKFTEKMRQDIVNSKVRSIGFLSEDEFKTLETKISNTMTAALGADQQLGGDS